MYITCHIAKRQLFAGNAAENISFFFFFFPHVVKFPRRFILLPTLYLSDKIVKTRVYLHNIHDIHAAKKLLCCCTDKFQYLRCI